MRIYLLALLTATALIACDRGDDAAGAASSAEGSGSAAAADEATDEAATDEAAADEAATDEGGSAPGAAAGDASVDHSDPAAVVQAMLDVATTTDWARLGGLCDPTGGNDGDTQRICNLATDADDRAEFIEVFRGGTLNGDTEITGDTATVPFLFGVTERRGEEMRLVQRDGRWYLASF